MITLHSSEELRSDSGYQLHDIPGKVVVSAIDELHAHPAYVLHRFAVPAAKLSTLADLGALAFVEPLVITRERIVIDGYARWELARRQGRPTLPCVEYALDDTEALQWLLQRHRRSNGLNDFWRILLALELEPALREKALLNQRVGSQGSSKLTKAGPLDVRSEIAKAAGVSAGNVTKVKQLVTSAHPEVLAALRSGEIRIHRAWKWSRESLETQLAALRLYQNKGLRKTVRALVSRHSRSDLNETAMDANVLLKLLSALNLTELGSVGVSIIHGSTPAIFVTEALAQSFQPFQESITTWTKNNR